MHETRNSSSQNNFITLYPSNWLYNAGVIGFLNRLDVIDNAAYRFEGNLVKIDRQVFRKINPEDYLNKSRFINLVGKNEYYRNLIAAQGNQKEVFKQYFLTYLGDKQVRDETQKECSFCVEPYYINYMSIVPSNYVDDAKKFFEKISRFSQPHNTLLGSSEGEFQNSHWNLKPKLKICNLCTFMIIHHHAVFTRLDDRSEMFINSPSFKDMYYLNKFVREVFISGAGSQDVRKILGMTLIEYTIRLRTTLGLWTAMNLEVVVKKGDRIDFLSLPYDVVTLLMDKNVSSLISSIGGATVLDFVLNQEYEKLYRMAYDLTRIMMKGREELSDYEEVLKFYLGIENLEGEIYDRLPMIVSKVLELYARIKDIYLKNIQLV